MENIMHPGSDRKKFWIKKVFFITIALAAGVIIFGSVVMYVWNAVLPEVTGVHSISFAEAVGILILSKILFGGFPNRHGRREIFLHGKEMREKWMNLSPEEKEKMREQWWNRFGHTDKND